jgi:hypothetical protein
MIRGSCLCGGVAYEIDGKVSPIGLCHCSKCRKYTGSAHGAVLVTAMRNLKWIRGEELIASYKVPSGYYAAFCSKCGSPVPKPRANKVYLVPAGTLDGDPGVKVAYHVHVASKAPWENIMDHLPQHDGHAPDYRT